MTVCEKKKYGRMKWICGANECVCDYTQHSYLMGKRNEITSCANALTNDSQDEWYNVTFKSINYGMNKPVLTTDFPKWFPFIGFNVTGQACIINGNEGCGQERDIDEQAMTSMNQLKRILKNTHRLHSVYDLNKNKTKRFLFLLVCSHKSRVKLPNRSHTATLFPLHFWLLFCPPTILPLINHLFGVTF